LNKVDKRKNQLVLSSKI